MSIDSVVNRVSKIKEVMSKIMNEGIHYGSIQATMKPSLYKAGAEILCLTFGLIAKFDYREVLLSNNHIKYTVLQS